jgi:flagellin-like protein
MRRNTSVGLSPLVAVILLIAITVAAAVVISGVFFNLAGIAGRRPTATIDQIKLVASPSPSATYAATFSIVLKNTGDVPISGSPPISFTYPVTGCSPSSTTGATWGGTFNPGGTLSATVTITGAACTLLGRTVTVTVTIDFADGSRQILTTAVTGAIA